MQLQLKPTIDYTVNERLNIQFYFTRVVSAPKVANAFKNTVTEGGFQLRYSLSQ
jgi:cell surface protein SprA